MVEDRPVPEKRNSAELKVEVKDSGVNPGANPDWAKDGDLMTTRTREMPKSQARTPGSDSQQKSLEIPKLPLAPESRRIEADSTKNNVLILDDYRETDILLKADKGFSHGELSARLRAFMRHVLSISDGVEKLQERGIKVVTAAGNKGADTLIILLRVRRRQPEAPRNKKNSHWGQTSAVE